MEPIGYLFLLLGGIFLVQFIVAVGRSFPFVGLFLGVMVWALVCAIVATRWDLQPQWVMAGSVGVVIVGAVLLYLVAVLIDRWNGR